MTGDDERRVRGAGWRRTARSRIRWRLGGRLVVPERQVGPALLGWRPRRGGIGPGRSPNVRTPAEDGGSSGSRFPSEFPPDAGTRATRRVRGSGWKTDCRHVHTAAEGWPAAALAGVNSPPRRVGGSAARGLDGPWSIRPDDAA